jgi:Cu(I)/Ag(I) efflux system membrane protein CusA/SilA
MYLTVAVWVGFIALFGITMDDGIVIGTYLEQRSSARPSPARRTSRSGSRRACAASVPA